jgi:hypothetical protein
MNSKEWDDVLGIEPKFKWFVAYWTRMEGFIFQSVPDEEAAYACQKYSGFNSVICLRERDNDPS